VYKVRFFVIPAEAVPKAFGTEPIEKTGFRLKDCRNDRDYTLVYTQTLINCFAVFTSYSILL
jgi:hypothetical protein